MILFHPAKWGGSSGRLFCTTPLMYFKRIERESGLVTEFAYLHCNQRVAYSKAVQSLIEKKKGKEKRK